MTEQFCFEEYTLDLDGGCLRGRDHEINLRPKTFAVLRHLVENAGRLVSKSDLIDAVWPEVTVSDESLTQCISEARRAFAVDLEPGEQHSMRTLIKVSAD